MRKENRMVFHQLCRLTGQPHPYVNYLLVCSPVLHKICWKNHGTDGLGPYQPRWGWVQRLLEWCDPEAYN